MKKIIFILCILATQFIYAKSILFLGDSLTEGLGVSKTEAYPHLVEELVKKRLNKNINAINGGVSGSTISDGLSRLKWYLKTQPNIIFVALGANDGLRGLNLKESQKNLEKIIDEALKSGAKVLLAGMLLPPNYGVEYRKDFKNMFIEVKDKYNLKFMPFLLKDVAGIQKLNQADGIHPTSQGYKIIANEVFEFLKDEL
ncbi:arylesterase [Halarcobacter sp.]|uniref:arylesterase n=1 Tax=Halarcobacter sp. TaxID=2321133 RepID=UPI002AAB6DB4|nr:arylesterase [Halarcobacter sp.]